MVAHVRFDRAGHLLRVPLHLSGETHLFLVDTGIGISVVSSEFARRADVSATDDRFTGRRMSGQVVAAPLVRLPALRLGDHAVPEHLAGVVYLGSDFAGILGPGFFDGHSISVDPDELTLTVGMETGTYAVTDPPGSCSLGSSCPAAAPFWSRSTPARRTSSWTAGSWRTAGCRPPTLVSRSPPAPTRRVTAGPGDTRRSAVPCIWRAPPRMCTGNLA